MAKKPSRDRALGMDRPITRRDFLNGIALGTTALATGAAPAVPAAVDASTAPPASALPEAAQDAAGYYPPLLTGLRGSHPGSFEVAHAWSRGEPWPPVEDTGEEYDLIVVGGGISGLAAAHFYRERASASSRILILDNHDDFGGHAKRNEFELQGRMQLLNGGTLEIDSPRPYSAVAMSLLRTLGIDVEALAARTQRPRFYEDLGMTRGVFFDRETFGADRLVAGIDVRPLAQCLEHAPLSARAREEIVRLETVPVDYLPGLSSEEKKQRLSRMSYEAFLRDVVRVDPKVLAYYHGRTMNEWGVGTDAVSALDCWGYSGLPGFAGMNLAKGSIARMGYTPAGYEDTGGSKTLHFPDGNATIARLLVRDLIPASFPGLAAPSLAATDPAAADRRAEAIVTARADYSRLDTSRAPVRLRLSSTAIRARHLGDPASAAEVQVTYVRAGKAYSARARGVVLAGYNMMIPFLCPELPAAQKAALHSLVKTPLVYTSVALGNWRAFEALKLSSIYAPGSYHVTTALNPHVDIGAYRSPATASEPILLHMVRTPCKAGLPEHEQNRAGRAELLATSFETFERNIREQLNRMLKDGGFDAARDITAITVNRWPHGYAPEYNPLFDPEIPEAQRAHVVGRAPFGRIVIANSDAGGAAYTDSAIDQAHRAIGELLGKAAA